MKMFAGLMSRWMMPAVWAASRASAIWMPSGEHRLEVEWTGGEPVLQRRALQILHGDERSPVLLADVIDRADVRVVQRRGGPGLALKAAQGRGITGSSSETNFSDHRAVKPRVYGLVDHAHAAAAELLDDAVVRERLTDQRIGAGLTAVVAALDPASSRAARSIAGAARNLSARSCAASSERSSPSSCASPSQARGETRPAPPRAAPAPTAAAYRRASSVQDPFRAAGACSAACLFHYLESRRRRSSIAPGDRCRRSSPSRCRPRARALAPAAGAPCASMGSTMTMPR